MCVILGVPMITQAMNRPEQYFSVHFGYNPGY